MNVLSLFDGISCGQVALQRAHVRVTNYYSSEIDKWAIKTCMKNWPNTVQVGNVVDLIGSTLPKIDLMIGGSPCQGFSNAGRLLGFADERSKLFWHFVRLLRECKPTIFMLENVRMRKEWQNIISRELGVNPIEINSGLVSAQLRRRLYWTNLEVAPLVDKYIYWRDVYEENADCFYYTDKAIAWLVGTSQRRNRYKEYKPDDEVKMQMVETSHYKGYSNQRCFAIMDIRGLRYISPVECERLQTLPDNYTFGVSNTQRYKQCGNCWTVDVVAHILGRVPFPYSIL